MSRCRVRHITVGMRALLISAILLGSVVCSHAQGLRSSVGSGKATDLVHYDDELIGFLNKVRKHIESKEYKEAGILIKALQDRGDSGFFPVESHRRYAAFWGQIHGLIELLISDPAGKRFYEGLYTPQAAQLYRQWESNGDIGLLRKIELEYRYTVYGFKAMESLARLDFDRGKFSQAAWRWSDMLRFADESEARSKPLLLAKIAVSLHLGGEKIKSIEVAKRLSDEYPSSAGVLGGVEQKYTVFVSKMLSRVVEASIGGFDRYNRDDWLGLWSYPGHCAWMDETDAVILPRWGPVIPSGDLTSLLKAKGELRNLKKNTNRNMQFEIELNGGQAVGQYTYSRKKTTIGIPSSIYPVLVDDLVISRLDKGIEARDIYTGELVWETVGLPLFRDLSKSSSARRISYYYGFTTLDYGRNALTVGNGKIYALANFSPAASYYPLRNQNLTAEQKALQADNSRLVAISIEAEGARVWRVGRGYGDQEITRKCKYLSVPTLHNDLVYVLVKYIEAYYVLCLDGEDSGNVVWSSMISQAPIAPSQGNQQARRLLDVGTPPVISDGRVFVLTSAGVIASFDAGTGKPIWAYQYDSKVGNISTSYQRQGTAQALSGMNPMIVSQDHVTVMPSDSDYLLSFSTKDGKLLWKTARQGMKYLSGIDDGRLLISNPGLMVISAKAGKILNQQNVSDVFGRPAITSTSVLTSRSGSLGGLYRFNLKTYALSNAGSAEPGSLLGNLVSVKGNLLAANALGVCAYVSYPQARESILSRLASASSDSERSEFLYDLGHLAFGAKRYDQSLRDFRACFTLAGTLGEDGESMLNQLRPRLYRTYIAAGNAKGDENIGEMGKLFTEAKKFAITRQAQAHLLLRTAKYYQRFGAMKKDAQALTKAIDIAIEITKDYGDELMVDVKIGVDANDMVWSDSNDRRVRGRVLSERLVANIIQDHGRSCYKVFDNAAGNALREAKEAKDPEAMILIAKTWKSSKWRSEAMFCAAEIYYLRARQQVDPAAKRASLSTTLSCLSTVRSDTNSEFATSATIAVAMIFSRGNRSVAAGLALEQVRDLPGSTRIKFADIAGTLKSLIVEIEGGESSANEYTPTSLAAWLPETLVERFEIKGDDIRILRNQSAEHVRIGQCVLMLKGNEVMLVDTSAENAADAIVWSGSRPANPNRKKQLTRYSASCNSIGGLSKDKSTIIVSDRYSATGFDAKTAKRKWHVTWQDFLKTSSPQSIAIGGDALIITTSLGQVICMNLSDGKLRWKEELSKTIWMKGGREVLMPSRSSSPTLIDGKIAVIRYNKNKSMLAYNITTGKLAGKWSSKSIIDVSFKRDGLMAVIAGGKFSLYETAVMHRPIWTRTYKEVDKPGILGMSATQICISPSQKTLDVEIMNLSGSGSVVKSFNADRIASSGRGVIVSAHFDEGGMYVLVASSINDTRKIVSGITSLVYGLCVQRYDNKQEKIIWSKELAPAGTYIYLPPAEVSTGHLIVMIYNRKKLANYWVVNTAGTKVTPASLIDKRVLPDKMRIIQLRSPVATSGYLCVETTTGIKILGGK